MKFKELIAANNILKQPLDLTVKQKAEDDFNLMDIVRMTDLALRRIIFMAKELSLFRKLRNDDQIALIKGL